MEEPTHTVSHTHTHHKASHVVRTLILIFLVFFPPFRSFSHSYLGYDWVGWRNDSLGWAGKPVEMVFEFDTVRNFSAMVLHTNNMFSKDVQVSFPPNTQKWEKKKKVQSRRRHTFPLVWWGCGGELDKCLQKHWSCARTHTRGEAQESPQPLCRVLAPGGLHKDRHCHSVVKPLVPEQDYVESASCFSFVFSLALHTHTHVARERG